MAVEVLAQGDVLAGQVRVVVGELLGHREGDLDRVGGERPHLGDLERVEAGALALGDVFAADGRRRNAEATAASAVEEPTKEAYRDSTEVSIRP